MAKRVYRRRLTVYPRRNRVAARQKRSRVSAIRKRRMSRPAKSGRRLKYARVSAPKMVLYKNLVKEKVLTSLKYVDTKTVDPSNGRVSHSFMINSLFDPDASGGGHQPAYHDQWAVLYNHYRVLSCRWSINFRMRRNFATAIQTADALGGLHMLNDTSHANQLQGNHIVFWEVGNTDTTRLTEVGDLNFIRETGRAMPGVSWRYLKSGGSTLRGTSSIRNILNDPASSNTATSFGSNPTNRAYLQVGTMSKDGTTAAQVRFDITLEFLVELSNPVDINES